MCTLDLDLLFLRLNVDILLYPVVSFAGMCRRAGAAVGAGGVGGEGAGPGVGAEFLAASGKL